MSLNTLLFTLEEQPFAMAIAESGWLFPTIECVHVVALALVIGTIALMDLRLLGLRETGARVTNIAAQLLPLTWCAFVMAAISGFLLFASQATLYAGNTPFRIKLALLGLAGLNMAAFHLSAYRRVNGWDTGRPPAAARMAGATSLTLWIGVVFLGRWIGFV